MDETREHMVFIKPQYLLGGDGVRHVFRVYRRGHVTVVPVQDKLILEPLSNIRHATPHDLETVVRKKHAAPNARSTCGEKR